MAMLAEPRQRKRYNLVPRGKALYEDEHRFGTKMLEKMGWKKGSGLGAKEDGSKDFVRIRYKNDALGLGFEHRDDQWTQHEQSFNGLLKTLNNEENSDDNNDKQEQNGNESEEEAPRIGFGFAPTTNSKVKKPNVEKLKEKISGVSLEERSKQSRARVHYKKFTKGKDLAQYSEKDLANIFGKKAVDEQQQAANDFYQQLNNSFGQQKPEETKDSDKEEKEETIKERYIINTGVSVNDYFKAKMEALKKRTNGVNNEETAEKKDVVANDVPEEETSKKKKKKKKEKKDQDDKEVEKVEVTSNEKKDDNSQMIYSSVSVNDYFKMKMEALKNKKKGLNPMETQEETNKCEELMQNEEVSKKKKKKKKSKEQENVEEPEQTEQANEDVEAALETSKKEKKSKKRKAEESEQKSIEEEEIKPKKKKDKTKNESQEKEPEQQTEQIDNSNETADQEITEIDLTQEEPKKKKHKKSKSKEPTEIIEIVESDQESTKEMKKKSKKEQNTTNTSETTENSTNTSTTVNSSAGKTSNKPRKNKRKEVSSTAKNIFKGDINFQELNLDELKKKYRSFNIYPISSFCAEKFRNMSLNNFTGSTLPQIEGYSLGPELQLDVQLDSRDEERITNLWNCVLNKYIQLEKPKKTYQSYVRNVIKARKAKQKPPKLYVKTWKRKNAFQAI